MRLGELLLQQKLITKDGLEEALESQVVHGGRLGTNLCELGLLQEKDLAKALGQLHNVAFASGEMHPDPAAMALLDPNYCDDKDILPMRVDTTRISLAVINPHDYETHQAIAFKTGLRVVPVIIPEFRMSQLLRRHCKAFRNVRAIDMNTIRPSKTLGTAVDQGPKPMAAEDLINEDEFQQLYAQAMVGATEGAPAAELELAEAEIETAPVAPAPQRLPVQPPQRPAAPVLQPVAAQATGPQLPTGMPPRQPGQPPPSAPQAAPVRAVPQEPPVTPLTFAEAQAALGKSDDRNDVARNVLRFALGKWKRALLLSVQGNLVTGWQGVGAGVNPAAVRRIGINLAIGQNSFKLVKDSRSHFIGPMKRDASTEVFYRLLGGGYPRTAVMMPLLVRGKVVHILYVDNGADQMTPPDIGELLILSQSVGRSYETMMRRRKSA